jgi:hypothetical protein
MNYLLPGLKEVWQDALTTAAIPFERKRYGTTPGLLVRDDDFLRALDAIGMEIDPTVEPVMPDTDVTIITLKPVQTTMTQPQETEKVMTKQEISPMLTVVTEGGLKSSYLERIKEITEKYLPKLGKSVIIHSGNDTRGQSQEPVLDGQFHIWIFSSPTGLPSQRVPQYWNDIQMERQEDHAFPPSGQGIAITAGESYAAGELVARDNLYIHHNLGMCGCDDEQGFFESVLEAALEQRPLTADEEAAVAHLLANKPKKVEVKRWSGDLDERAVVKKAREILVPIIDRDITIYGRSGEPKLLDPFPGLFNIHFWSTPHGNRNATAPDNIWGFRVDRRDRAFTPSGRGVPIVDSDTGWAVAELLDDDLYIHHDLSYDGGPNANGILKRLLEEVAQIWHESAQVRAERLETYKIAQRQAARKFYLEQCLKSHHELVQKQQQIVSMGHESIGSLQRQLTEKIRQTIGAEKLLNSLKNGGDNRAVYDQEYENLLAIPQVRDIQMQDGTLLVETNAIYCVDPRDNKTHELGCYRIEISLEGVVKWFNLGGAQRGYHGGRFQAPHVRENGIACLGKMETVFPDLIAKNEFAVVTQLAIAFLENLNVTDPGEAWGPENIHSWPVVTPPTPTQEN